MSTRIKICGITRPEDADTAVRLGVHALGLNFHPGSKRFVTPSLAREIVAAAGPFVEIVGVFVNHAPADILNIARETGITAVQLHGTEPSGIARQLREGVPLRIYRAFPWCGGTVTLAAVHQWIGDADPAQREDGVAGILIDTARDGAFGGTGTNWPWNEAVSLPWPKPIIVAGGLSSENVGEAIEQLRPAGVDAAGGVESAPGIKDPARLLAFVEAVQRADAERGPVP